jgi:hypothetical protein
MVGLARAMKVPSGGSVIVKDRTGMRSSLCYSTDPLSLKGCPAADCTRKTEIASLLAIASKNEKEIHMPTLAS